MPARAFVERTASHQSALEAGEGRGAPLPAFSAPDRNCLSHLPCAPESLHVRLLYIAENGSEPIYQFVIEALVPAVEQLLGKSNGARN